jgi:hypothetical protein
MSDHRIVLCEVCGSEGRILTGHPNDPYPRDGGPCPACEGTGLEVIEVEPITEEDLDYESEMAREHGPGLIREW